MSQRDQHRILTFLSNIPVVCEFLSKASREGKMKEFGAISLEMSPRDVVVMINKLRKIQE